MAAVAGEWLTNGTEWTDHNMGSMKLFPEGQQVQVSELVCRSGCYRECHRFIGCNFVWVGRYWSEYPFLL